VRYDPTLVIGILGGSAGTTCDAFKLLAEAQKHGARVALFGRKINNAEHQLAFISMLRLIVEGQIGPEEAVHAYHGVLQELNIKPVRTLADDLQLTEPVFGYSTGRTVVTVPAALARTAAGRTLTTRGRAAERPDFGKMTRAERLAYFRQRLRGVGDRG
jgi:hypothetical protein